MNDLVYFGIGTCEDSGRVIGAIFTSAANPMEIITVPKEYFWLSRGSTLELGEVESTLALIPQGELDRASKSMLSLQT
ncbi:MAG: hypothetical protein HRT94_01960 [Alphaproteobacteria bacterium]|nr:hypothetical protein [Alphaproteobacteria bacterium]